ncbi:MAG TPA: flagellar motor protein MotA, partial [Myxococcaceae bacterium]|nr:flagellar motor protein MotA [Myxococcaceae bacterium]
MQQFNLIEMWRSMLPLAKTVVIILAIMSVYSLWVMIDRFAVFTRAKRYSLAFVLALREQLKSRDLEGALRLSQRKPQSPIARVVAEALSEYRDGIYALTHTGPDELGEFDVVDAVNR